MGRVEDAMRRAATQPDGVAPEPADAADLTSTLFPVETPEDKSAAELVDVEFDTAVGAGSNGDEESPFNPGETPAAPARRGGRWFGDVIEARLAGKLVVDQTMSHASREQYRRLAAVLHHAQVSTGMKVVMIASAVVGEGKSLTASNLSLTLSESYERRVLLMDADLRRPSLHTIFGVETVPGLSDALVALEQRPLPLHQVSERLTLLPAGRPSSDPMAGLTSLRMQELLEEARERFDWVIIDTPPIALMTDANLLAAMADGALLVIKAGTTPYQMAERAIEAIGRGRLLGAVLNRATDLDDHGNKYYNYYYGRSPEASAARG